MLVETVRLSKRQLRLLTVSRQHPIDRDVKSPEAFDSLVNLQLITSSGEITDNGRYVLNTPQPEEEPHVDENQKIRELAPPPREQRRSPESHRRIIPNQGSNRGHSGYKNRR